MACCDPVAASPEACVRPAGVSAAEHQRNAAGGVEEPGQRVGDILLIDIKAARRAEVQRQIQVGIVGVVTQARVEVRRHVGVDQRAERADDAAGRINDGVLLRDIAPSREIRIHRGAAECCAAGDVGAVGIGRRNLDHVARRRGEHEVALHGQQADGIAGRERAAIDGGVAHGAVAAQRAPGIHGQRRRRDRAVDAQACRRRPWSRRCRC